MKDILKYVAKNTTSILVVCKPSQHSYNTAVNKSVSNAEMFKYFKGVKVRDFDERVLAEVSHVVIERPQGLVSVFGTYAEAEAYYKDAALSQEELDNLIQKLYDDGQLEFVE